MVDWLYDPDDISLGDLGDVDITTTPPDGGQALVFDDGSGLWIPGGAGGSIAVDDDEVEVVAAASRLNFGDNLDVTDDGGGQVTIDAAAGGGSVAIARGTASIEHPSTTVDVPHGQEDEPDLQDVQITPTNDLGDASKWWLAGVDADDITIAVDVSPGSGTPADFVWWCLGGGSTPPPAALSIASHSWNDSGGSTTNSLVVSKPSGTEEGDLLIGLLGAVNSISSPALGGFTLLRHQTGGASTSQQSAVAFTLVAGASEPSNYTFSWTNNRLAAAGILRIPGGAIEDDSGAGLNTASLELPAVLGADGGLLVAFAAWRLSSEPIGYPSPMTSVEESSFTGTSPIGFGVEAVTADGMTGTRTLTVNTANNVAGALLSVGPA